MSTHERTELYISLAQTLEQQTKLSEAENLYLIVNEFDLAINRYKKREEYEQMLRLVSKYRKELLNDTYKHIAEQYEMKGILRRQSITMWRPRCGQARCRCTGSWRNARM